MHLTNNDLAELRATLETHIANNMPFMGHRPLRHCVALIDQYFRFKRQYIELEKQHKELKAELKRLKDLNRL